MGDLSRHFSWREFACKHCGQVRLRDGLVARLELTRAEVGRPLVVVSGYRCAVHNRAVGGAPGSRHLAGDAVDLKSGYLRPPQARKLGWKGIGVRAGWVVHVDMRPGPVVEFKD